MCRVDPCTRFGCNMPQYCRHFRRIMPTMRPVGDRSAASDTLICGNKSASSSNTSSGLSVSSCKMISLGAVHFSSGNISTATISPSTARFSASRPWISIWNKIRLIVRLESQKFVSISILQTFRSLPHSRILPNSFPATRQRHLDVTGHL